MIDGSSQLVLVSGFLRVEVKRLWQLTVGTVVQCLPASDGRTSLCTVPPLTHSLLSAGGLLHSRGQSGALCLPLHLPGISRYTDSTLLSTVQEVTYNGCTNASDQEGRLWCATKVDQNGDYILYSEAYGFCESSCPVHQTG